MGAFCSKEKQTPEETREDKELQSEVPDIIFQGLGLEHILNGDDYECADVHLKAFDDLIVRVRRVQEGIWLLCSDGIVYFLHHESRKWFFVDEIDGEMKGRMIREAEKEHFHSLLVSLCHELEARAKDHMTYLDLFNDWRLHSKKKLTEMEQKIKQRKEQQAATEQNRT